MTPEAIGDIISNRRFCGLWAFHPHGGHRQYCATVMLASGWCETDMFDDWRDAVRAAWHILKAENLV